MAAVGGLLSPPLRRVNSESRLLARQRTGSAILGLPELKSSSSAALGKLELRSLDGLPSLLTSFSPLHNESRTTLPPIFESYRGMLRQSASPQERWRPAKRSRSSAALSAAQIQEAQIGARSTLPSLSKSKSTEAPEAMPESDIEQALVTALALSTDAGAQETFKPPCRSSADIEAHLQGLIDSIDQHAVNVKPKKKKDRRVRVSDSHGDNKNNIRRKGTGFVCLYPSPGDSPDRHAKIIDEHVDNQSNIVRKGTGFVHLSELPLGEATTCHAKIVDDHGDNENKLCRKGTGFVHLNASPEKENRHCVRIHDSHGDNENNICRNGTGFVHLSALPKDSSSVQFVDTTGGNVNGIQRKGTGFIDLSGSDCDLLPASPSSSSCESVDIM